MKNCFTPFILLLSSLLPTGICAQGIGDTFSEGGIDFRIVSEEAVSIVGGSVEGTLTVAADVEHNSQSYAITEIADEAFRNSSLSVLDLSAATSLQRIGVSAFAECQSLEIVTFPAASESSLTEIGTLAFHHAFALKQMNLEDTRIEVLESLFSENEADEITIEGLTKLRLPETLKEIKKYALQFLDITEIEIPSGVTSFADRVLEGCIRLREVTWIGAQITKVPRYTFLGDDQLEKVMIITVAPLSPDGLTDLHFYMCDKELLKIVLTAESIANLATAGYTNESSVYSTLVPYAGSEDDPTTIVSHSQKAESTLAEAPYYSLQGQRVDHPQPGQLYIHGGRKVVFK